MLAEDKLNYIRITDDKTEVRHCVSFWYILSNEIMWWKQHGRFYWAQKYTAWAWIEYPLQAPLADRKSVHHVR